MSIHAIPAGVTMATLNPHLVRDLRKPSRMIEETSVSAPPQVTALEFTPDLSAAEQTTLARIFSAATKGFDLTAGEYQAIKDEVATLSAYLGVATPTLVQTATALKALIRVVRAMVRE